MFLFSKPGKAWIVLQQRCCFGLPPASFFFSVLSLLSSFAGFFEFSGVYKQVVSRFNDSCKKPERIIFLMLLIKCQSIFRRKLMFANHVSNRENL